LRRHDTGVSASGVLPEEGMRYVRTFGTRSIAIESQDTLDPLNHA
jgi:hypothetical protein